MSDEFLDKARSGLNPSGEQRKEVSAALNRRLGVALGAEPSPSSEQGRSRRLGVMSNGAKSAAPQRFQRRRSVKGAGWVVGVSVLALSTAAAAAAAGGLFGAPGSRLVEMARSLLLPEDTADEKQPRSVQRAARNKGLLHTRAPESLLQRGPPPASDVPEPSSISKPVQEPHVGAQETAPSVHSSRSQPDPKLAVPSSASSRKNSGRRNSVPPRASDRKNAGRRSVVTPPVNRHTVVPSTKRGVARFTTLENNTVKSVEPRVSLREEVQALKQARSALHQGDPEQALQALKPLDSVPGKQLLREERSALQALSRCHAAQRRPQLRAAAVAKARQFLANYPGSVSAAVIRDCVAKLGERIAPDEEKN